MLCYNWDYDFLDLNKTHFENSVFPSSREKVERH
jgi:hypothetical protein